MEKLIWFRQEPEKLTYATQQNLEKSGPTVLQIKSDCFVIVFFSKFRSGSSTILKNCNLLYYTYTYIYTYFGPGESKPMRFFLKTGSRLLTDAGIGWPGTFVKSAKKTSS